jgi:aryl-alcohol dehydrogenase-like predicted oxidoreductase
MYKLGGMSNTSRKQCKQSANVQGSCCLVVQRNNLANAYQSRTNTKGEEKYEWCRSETLGSLAGRGLRQCLLRTRHFNSTCTFHRRANKSAFLVQHRAAERRCTFSMLVDSSAFS